jgi:endonuclease/exonuclease/phosphatase family metal-dependent hydrolase
MHRRSGALVAVIVVSLALGITPQASAGTVPPHTPPTDIQVWTVNIRHLGNTWRGFVDRMVANDFAPDIVLVQEVTSTELGTFMIDLKANLGTHYSSDLSTGDNAVIWNTQRFSKLGRAEWAQQSNGCGNGKTALAVNLRDNDAGTVFLETRNVVAASVHFRTNMDDSCLNHTWFQANSNIESAFPIRRMTILGGDVNRKPDRHRVAGVETAASGLETDPNCWYRRASAAHLNDSLLDGACGTAAYDRYYDTVWTYPGSGGGTNPTATSFCEQFTFNNAVDLLGSGPDTNDVSNSCTDVAPIDDALDKSRIDYVWISYERADGSAWTPPATAVAPHIAFASADFGLSLDVGDLAESYSDHRAVQTLLTWPAVMPSDAA